jgi:hypothetical protein
MIAFCFLLPAMLIFTLAFIAHNGQFGGFAKSPQTANLWLGGSVIVGGGKAKLWFREVDLGPSIEVGCPTQTRVLQLSDDEPSEEVCGVRLQLIKLDVEGPRSPHAEIRVTWSQ